MTLSPSLQIIGVKSFYNCKALTSISIPANVTSIGEEALAYCTNLANLTLNSSALIPCPANILTASGIKNIYVPTALVNTYKASDGWSTFAGQITSIP